MDDILRFSSAGSCSHANVRVDYDHPFGLIRDVLVTELRASNPAETRPVMTLMNPRCGDCGAELDAEALRTRTQPGADLFDPRFRWSWRRGT